MDMNLIQNKMLKLGFRISSVGFEYWTTAVKIYQKGNVKRMNIMYETIAKKYNTTYTRVERAMRYTTENARIIIRKKYDLDKVNNIVILELLIREL